MFLGKIQGISAVSSPIQGSEKIPKHDCTLTCPRSKFNHANAYEYLRGTIISNPAVYVST